MSGNSTPSTRLVFLDFDGVLNSFDWWKRRPSKGEHTMLDRCLHNLDPDALKRLGRLLEASGAYVVVSSVWRKNWTLLQLQNMLESRGLERQYALRLRGCTPEHQQIRDGKTGRGWEIDTWLEVTPNANFVIIDDDSDMDPHMDRLVQTEPEWGLTDERVDQALRILGVLP